MPADHRPDGGLPAKGHRCGYGCLPGAIAQQDHPHRRCHRRTIEFCDAACGRQNGLTRLVTDKAVCVRSDFFNHFLLLLMVRKHR